MGLGICYGGAYSCSEVNVSGRGGLGVKSISCRLDLLHTNGARHDCKFAKTVSKHHFPTADKVMLTENKLF